jgi:hypothetical protein
VFDRIEMEVVQVPPHVVLVTQPMFPVAMLPKAAMSLHPPTLRHHGGVAKTCPKLMRHASLDESPARRKVVVTGRQGPDGMQMIRQQDPAIDPEWPLLANGLDMAGYAFG